MATLITTYAVALAAVGGYAAWLAVNARRTARRLYRLESHRAEPSNNLTHIQTAA